MRYMRVEWRHDHADEPVLLFSEVECGQEVRKVEIFRSGEMGYADALTSRGGTVLGEGMIPTLEEINSSEEFMGREIGAADFERIWNQAHET
ncbi:DUF6881 domain-containing protein [Spongisporangium articulatum]|uniref:DUF6881 domain-containing protein n=1 Tax=Spongisporangium articulatum TaxID=3362603 RepID=A0ABW8AU41_9ACTN